MARELQVRSEHGRPLGFRWRGQYHHIRSVLERWKDTGRWWEGEAPKLFYRVETVGGGLWEIFLDTAEHRWYLYKIYD